jgi:nucleotide-binding universal stress UspA family protein
MRPIKSILFPVDFSPSCVAMAAYVKRVASIFDASVTLVHVVDPRDVDIAEAMSLAVWSEEEMRRNHEQVHKERIGNFLAEDFGASNSRVLLHGDPATEISSYAQKHAIDLIVMPTHSGRFRQMLLGSTTARVINDAPCPVLTSRHAETIAPRPPSHRHWICAIDASSYAETLLTAGLAFAKQANAQLSLLHVIQFESALQTRDPLGSALSGAAIEPPQLLTELIKKHGPGTPLKTVVGSLKKTLVEVMASEQADGLIIGRSPDQSAGRRMTDLTYALVRDSPFPVVSV